MQNLQIIRPSTALKTNQKQDKDWRKWNLNMILVQLLMEQLHHGYLLTMTADSMLLIIYHEIRFWYISLDSHTCCFVSFSPIWNKDKIWKCYHLRFYSGSVPAKIHGRFASLFFLVFCFSVFRRWNDKMLCAPFCDCVWRRSGGLADGLLADGPPFSGGQCPHTCPTRAPGHASPIPVCYSKPQPEVVWKEFFSASSWGKVRMLSP